MIQQLLQLIMGQLVAGMAGQMDTPASRITLGPVESPPLTARPRVALEAANLALKHSVGDDSTGQPRSLEARERIPVNAGNPSAPYVLGNPPLDGTVSVRAVYDEGLVSEYSRDLVPVTEFSVSVPAKSVVLTKDIAGAKALRIGYSYVGNATMKEFDQEFRITFYLNGTADTDRWVGLTAAIVQSQQALLLDQFNFQTPTSFAANNYTCQVFLQKVKLLRIESLPRVAGQAAADVVIGMSFLATGQMRLGQSAVAGFGIIQSIHTRGASGSGVVIKPGLG
ncbi:MAG: hypothetical protein RLZZ165_1705 [Bacteroidota bacterium]